MTYFIVLGLIIVVALAYGFRYDRKHRPMGGSGGGRTARETRLHGREKGSEWGAGGAG